MLQADASKKVMTKLPANLFCDFSENGGLARILCCALRYKNEKVGGRDVLESCLACLPRANPAALASIGPQSCSACHANYSNGWSVMRTQGGSAGVSGGKPPWWKISIGE